MATVSPLGSRNPEKIFHSDASYYKGGQEKGDEEKFVDCVGKKNDMLSNLENLISNRDSLKEKNLQFLRDSGVLEERIPEILKDMEDLDSIISTRTDYSKEIEKQIKKKQKREPISWKNRFKLIWRILTGDDIWRTTK